jgi:hypothetical protein
VHNICVSRLRTAYLRNDIGLACLKLCTIEEMLRSQYFSFIQWLDSNGNKKDSWFVDLNVGGVSKFDNIIHTT